jgi:hypothetical protein
MSATKKLVIDPDSGLPVGSIVANARGQYGVIEYRKVRYLTKEEADELLKYARSLDRDGKPG